MKKANKRTHQKEHSEEVQLYAQNMTPYVKESINDQLKELLTEQLEQDRAKRRFEAVLAENTRLRTALKEQRGKALLWQTITITILVTLYGVLFAKMLQ